MNKQALLTFFSDLHAQIFDPERLPVAVAAILIVTIVGIATGPLGGSANPFLWKCIDFLFGPLGGKLDKTGRKAVELTTRGFFVTVVAMVVAFLIGHSFKLLSIHYPNFLIVDIIALTFVMSSGAAWYALVRLYKAMNSKHVKGAFYTLATTTRTNLSVSDEFTITRVGIGMGAKLFDKGIVAPVLWYLIGGLPVAYLYACLAALSWRFGKEGFTKGFGDTAMALEKLFGFVPNVFSGILLALAGLITPTAGMTRSLLAILPARKGHAEYQEGGSAVTAMAWALRVSLGGPTQDQDGYPVQRGWAGPAGATARLEAKHLHRALYITVVAHLLFLAALLGGIVLYGHGFLS